MISEKMALGVGVAVVRDFLAKMEQSSDSQMESLLHSMAGRVCG